MSGYNVEQFWKVKDKAWLAERKAKWQRLANLLKKHYTGTEIRVFEQYFVKGNLKFVDNRVYGIPLKPELSLLLQLAWHPSDDETVWQQIFAYNCKEFDVIQLGYECIGVYGDALFPREWLEPEIAQSLFCDREGILYCFFFQNTALLNYLTTLSGNTFDMEKAKGKLDTHLRLAVSAFLTTDFESKYVVIKNSFTHQYLNHISEFFTSERYQKISIDKDMLRFVNKRFSDMAKLYAMRGQFAGEREVVASLLNSQLEKSAPEWRALWQKCKQDAQENYEAPARKPVQKEIKTDPAYVHNSGKKPKLKQSPPWPDELVALKQHLEQQGYPVTTTEAEANAILQQHFANRCVYFGSFIESMQLETEDYDKPYPAFTAPLQALCDIKGDANLSYTRRGERITIKVNGERLGVADLEEPSEDEDTTAYFAAIIRLAQQWFGQQVFVYGYESLHLYILPTELVSWLEANGFTNSLNYFGGAATEEQPLAGLTLVFTGVFSAGSREEMEYEAEQLGANVQKTVNSKTNYLVCGAKVGASKLARAEALGVKVLSEAEYQALSRQGE